MQAVPEEMSDEKKRLEYERVMNDALEEQNVDIKKLVRMMRSNDPEQRSNAKRIFDGARLVLRLQEVLPRKRRPSRQPLLPESPAECFDVVMQSEEKIADYVQEDQDNVVFLFRPKEGSNVVAQCSSFSSLLSSFTSPNMIVFECEPLDYTQYTRDGMAREA